MRPPLADDLPRISLDRHQPDELGSEDSKIKSPVGLPKLQRLEQLGKGFTRAGHGAVYGASGVRSQGSLGGVPWRALGLGSRGPGLVLGKAPAVLSMRLVRSPARCHPLVVGLFSWGARSVAVVSSRWKKAGGAPGRTSGSLALMRQLM